MRVDVRDAKTEDEAFGVVDVDNEWDERMVKVRRMAFGQGREAAEPVTAEAAGPARRTRFLDNMSSGLCEGTCERRCSTRRR